MFVTGIVPTHVDSIKWQDYRGSRTGMIVYYNTDPIAELPIREIPEEIPSPVIADPHYETGTFGLYGCKHTKTRASFVKKKLSYLFFMTRYAGTNVEYMDDLMVTGFYDIKHTADAQRLHIRYLDEYSCVDETACLALRGDVIHFVSVEDAFKITPEVLESWESKSRITRQTKIILDREKTAELIEYLTGKVNVYPDYKEETERLQPEIEDYDIDDDDEDEDEEEDY
jgi:hypothetical protein